MGARSLAAFALAALSVAAQAASPEVEELMALDRKLAKADCVTKRVEFEWYIASGAGDTDRARALQAEMGKTDPASAPLRTRRDQLLKAKLSSADQAAYLQFHVQQRKLCPYAMIKDGSVPQDLPPAKSAAEARNYVNEYVPMVLAKWRLCEAFEPQRRGELERGWAASRFAKLDVPEMQAMATDVRGWMKDGLKIHPDSRLAKDKQKPGAQAPGCTGEADLKRIEAAMPAGFLK